MPARRAEIPARADMPASPSCRPIFERRAAARSFAGRETEATGAIALRGQIAGGPLSDLTPRPTEPRRGRNASRKDGQARRDLQRGGTSGSPVRTIAMVLEPEAFRRLCRARAILCDVGDDNPTVAELAARLGMSSFQLIRSFEAVFGLTPHQLRTRARLERAKHLLAADRPVTRRVPGGGLLQPRELQQPLHAFARGRRRPATGVARGRWCRSPARFRQR
jgi:AraC-like DNA-binding protein